MAESTKIIETVPFSFDEIYAGIAEKFSEKGYDSPYDGSNLAQLITSMAYTTSMLNANTAININETILSLAQKRTNVIQDARLLGYEPEQKVSYVYDLKIELLKTQLYTIQKYQKFTSGENSYYYMGSDLDINAVAGDIITIPVKEGTLIQHSEDPLLTHVVQDKQYMDIPFNDIENNGLEVFITYYTVDGILTNRKKFEKADTLLMDVTDNLNNQFIRLEDPEMKTPRIYFVLSGIGNPLPVGAIVEVDILKSHDVEGIMTQMPTTSLHDVKIIDYILTIKGTDIESIESIKTNAPLLNNTSNRVVTANDYRVIAQKHSACKQAFIFGGEDEHPIKLGNIFLSFTPEKMFRVFSSNTDKTLWVLNNKEDITNNYPLDKEIEAIDLNDDPGILDNIRALNLPALKYNVRSPLYMFLDISITIAKYSLASNHKEVRTGIFNITDKYIEELEVFDSEFFKSNLNKRLDEYLTDVTGIDTSVKFNIMLDEKSIIQENEDYNEYNIVLYLDTSYEGTYDKKGKLQIKNLPMIDTIGFVPGNNLSVDFSGYSSGMKADSDKEVIDFPVILGGKKVGVYSIFNDRTIYIRVKLYLTDGVGFPPVPLDYTVSSEYRGVTPINIDYFNTPRYINLVQPSENIKTIRNTIFKLNQVEIH